MTGISEKHLQDYGTLSANLAQGAYENRPNSFTHKDLGDRDHESLDLGHPVKLELNPKGAPKNLYLQPSPDDKAIHTVVPVTDAAPSGPVTNLASKEVDHTSLFQDPKTGFSGYLLTDTKTFDKDTKNVYIAVRGSDGVDASNILDIKNVNDWFYNYKFVMGDGYTEQAKEAKAAISQTISRMKKESPEAKLHISGHSLGTIDTIEALSQLSEDELNHIDSVDLYDGPDGSDAIKKLNKKNLAKLKNFKSKITYHVNAFDMVSMLNRNNGEEIGTVRYIVPLNTNGTLDGQVLTGNNEISAHDFGQIQHKDGQIVYADMATHPEIFLAGKKLSALIAQEKPILLEALLARLKKMDLSQAEVEQLAKKFADGSSVKGLLDFLWNIMVRKHHSKGEIERQLKEALLPIYEDFKEKYDRICQDTQDLYDGKKLDPDYMKELQAFRRDWLMKLRKTLSTSGGGLSANEKIYLDEQEALYATQHYQELMFNVADEAVRVLNQKIPEIQDSWMNTFAQANAFAPDITINERLDALEAGGATQATVDQLVVQDIESDIYEVEKGKVLYEDFISSIEQAMDNLLAKDKELAQLIEAAQQPG